MKASESCNTAMERQFCELSEYVQILKLDILIKCKAQYMQGSACLVYAEVKIVGIKNLQF